MIIKMCFRNKSSMPYSNIFFKFTIMKCKNYRIINEEDLCNCFYFNPKTDQWLISFPWRLKEKTQMSCKVVKKLQKVCILLACNTFSKLSRLLKTPQRQNETSSMSWRENESSIRFYIYLLQVFFALFLVGKIGQKLHRKQWW